MVIRSVGGASISVKQKSNYLLEISVAYLLLFETWIDRWTSCCLIIFEETLISKKNLVKRHLCNLRIGKYCKKMKRRHSQACIYLLKVNNRNTGTMWEICSKLTIKTINNGVVLVSLLLTLNIWCLYC